MRTYVKIEGQNVEPIVQKLAKIAIDTPEICVWDFNMQTALQQGGVVGPREYWGMNEDDYDKECSRIIAKSGEDLGDNSIYFEWLTPPSYEQLKGLRRKIDDILKPFGNKYVVINKA